MREIKFRAWRKSSQTMASWASVLSYIGHVCKDVPAFFEGEHDNDVVLMQFTGLKDRKGVEIYEGDILGTKGERSLPNGARVVGTYCFENGTRDVVEWDRDCWRVGTKDLAEWLWSAERYSNGEVIGNIYENPELLENKDA